MQDGRNWARIEADHHTHALFGRGAEGEWDALYIGAPQVLAAGPKDMRLWYHSYDAGQQRFRVGLATSEDGFKCAAPPAPAGHVLAYAPKPAARAALRTRMRSGRRAVCDACCAVQVGEARAGV